MVEEGEPSLLTLAQLRETLGPELNERFSKRGINALSRACDEFAARILSSAYVCASFRAPLRGADIWESLLRDTEASWLRSHFEIEEPQAADEPQGTDEISGTLLSQRIITFMHDAFVHGTPARTKAPGLRSAFLRTPVRPRASSRPVRAPGTLRPSFMK